MHATQGVHDMKDLIDSETPQVQVALKQIAQTVPPDFKVEMTEGALAGLKKALTSKTSFLDYLREHSESIVFEGNITCDCSPDPDVTLDIEIHKLSYGPYVAFNCQANRPYTKKPFALHPLRQCRPHILDTAIEEDKREISAGGILADNSMVRLMLEYLVYSDEKLEPLVRNSHTTEYRACLIAALESLAD